MRACKSTCIIGAPRWQSIQEDWELRCMDRFGRRLSHKMDRPIPYYRHSDLILVVEELSADSRHCMSPWVRWDRSLVSGKHAVNEEVKQGRATESERRNARKKG